MDASVITALTALAGAAIGGLTSIAASIFTQHAQLRVRWLAQEVVRRQYLYKEFIESASRCYTDALQTDKANIPARVVMYTKIGRMRVLSSAKVMENAEEIARRILDTHLEPNKTFPELRVMLRRNAVDILRDFEEACREEFEALRTGKLG
jgi:hypothetical protein